MYLKSIEMQGFKSFPDRTKLVFDKRDAVGDDGAGVTVIVGPNGSGKSNVADAMRWVLGEISSKTLRGSKMEDVIFGGADSRRPMGFAEVSVTFDNTSGQGRLDCPYDEVIVTRRYFRAGESEYLINRKPVRLKDIYELFLNTGIGRDGYSIIGQGKIAEIISQKSDERRSIFEDASGIAKYRVKKNEAARKLDATEANMTRIRDIFIEVEAQVGPLERESEKAKRALVLLDSKKRADISLWLYDTEKLKTNIDSAEEIRAHASFDLSQAEDELQSLDVQNKRLMEISQNSKQASAELLDEISGLTEVIHKLDSTFKVTENNIAHTKELIESASENKQALLRQRDCELTQLNAHKERISQLEDSVKEERAAFDSNAREIVELQEKVSALDTDIALISKDISDSESEAVDMAVRVSVLESARDSGNDRNSGIISEMEQYESVSCELEGKCAEQQKKVDKYNATFEEAQAQFEECDKRLAELNGQYGEMYERMASEKLRRDSIAQRIATYKAMEEHFEGYAASVRYVMKQYTEGNIRDFHGNPCGKIYGPLSKVISVDTPYITAIETALGANLQNIVVEDEATAKSAMYCLKRGEAGRATFFPLTSMRPSNVTDEMRQAAGYEGYVAVADTLVSYDAKFTNVISSLLGRTVVFDNIDNATQMAKSLKFRVRVVTLDGQQINVGGSFTGGSAVQKNGALSRAGEVKRMTEELSELDARLAEREGELADIKSLISKADNERMSFEDKRELSRVLRASEQSQLDQLQAKLDANNTLLSRMREDCEQILKMSEQYEEDMKTLRADEKALREKIEQLRELKMEKAEAKGDAEDSVDKLESEQTRLFIKMSEINKDIETEETLIRVCEERIAVCDADISASDERTETHKQRISDYEVAQVENRKQADANRKVLDELTKKRAVAEQNSAEFEEKLAALSEKLRAKMSEKENIFREFTTADTKLNSLKADMDKLSSKLWDDYEITRAEALGLGYPPVTKENRSEMTALQTECRNKLRAIGHFDPDAVEKYKEVKERYEYMKAQIDDLERSREELTGIISSLESEMKVAFVEAFNAINENFAVTFAELFGGGVAELSLSDPENVLESGIEIKAAPPGKIIKSLMQLSGGEQAFVGVALFFAILKVNPTPFCILDEIEAALDEVNVERLAQYIKRYTDDTQFIMITHRRGTMAAASTLYGVTMPERGISKVLTLDVADISKNKEQDWDGIFS
ncbi:MAG: chromosome segregation protein SMC [Ruminococcaceae bacterium]|nr:chromosome segregation protein SMC [Oscillospiraceae bacterium]